MNRYLLALALSAVIPVSILEAQVILTPTFNSTSAVSSNTGSGGFTNPFDTANGILNTSSQADGFLYNSTAANGVINPVFDYTLNVGANTGLVTDFDLFNVVGSANGERLTEFDLLIVDSTNSLVFSQNGITENSGPNSAFGDSINVDLSAVGLGTGTYSVFLTDRSGELHNREFSEVRFTAAAVPEPTSGLILGALGSLALLRRRKR